MELKRCNNCANGAWSCKESALPEVCLNCNFLSDGSPSEWKPKIATNADKIRAMTDEELAEFIFLSAEMATTASRGGCVMADREKLIELLMDKPFGNSTEEREIAHAEDVAEYLISNGVTVRERGRWIVKGQDVFCSHCDKESGHNQWGASAFSDYCPNCGADMRGEEDGK